MYQTETLRDIISPLLARKNYVEAADHFNRIGLDVEMERNLRAYIELFQTIDSGMAVHPYIVKESDPIMNEVPHRLSSEQESILSILKEFTLVLFFLMDREETFLHLYNEILIMDYNYYQTQDLVQMVENLIEENLEENYGSPETCTQQKIQDRKNEKSRRKSEIFSQIPLLTDISTAVAREKETSLVHLHVYKEIIQELLLGKPDLTLSYLYEQIHALSQADLPPEIIDSVVAKKKFLIDFLSTPEFSSLIHKYVVVLIREYDIQI